MCENCARSSYIQITNSPVNRLHHVWSKKLKKKQLLTSFISTLVLGQIQQTATLYFYVEALPQPNKSARPGSLLKPTTVVTPGAFWNFLAKNAPFEFTRQNLVCRSWVTYEHIPCHISHLERQFIKIAWTPPSFFFARTLTQISSTKSAGDHLFILPECSSCAKATVLIWLLATKPISPHYPKRQNSLFYL